MPKQVEVVRFSSSGKTFFFNKAPAQNGSPYLTINSIYGKGNRERTILFEGHFMQYYRCLKEAIENTFGVTLNGGGPTKCSCGSSREDSRAVESKDHQHWIIVCRSCGNIFDHSSEESAKIVCKEQGWDVKHEG